jgi:trimeric autotransporter adhesin
MKSAASYFTKGLPLIFLILGEVVYSQGLWKGTYLSTASVTTFAGKQCYHLGALSGIIRDDAGNLYISDVERNQIIKLTPGGAMSTFAGGNESGYRDGGVSLFDMPLGLAFDTDGSLLVADNGNNLIRRIDKNGNVTTVAGSIRGGYQDGSDTNALFLEPSGIAATTNGIYVADSGNNLIRRIDKNGYVTTVAGGLAGGYNDAKGTNALFLQPSDLASDKKGNLYVVDTGNNLIRKIDPTGTVSTLAGSQVAGYVDDLGTNALFSSPSGITIDAQGVLSVSDSGNNAIRRIDTNGNVSTLAGGSFPGGRVDGAGTIALFADPTGITVDPTGNLYVAEWVNSDLRCVDTSGVVSTIAAPVYPMQDGTSNNATFNNPAGLALDGSGNLYVADSGNNSIRVIHTNGAVATVAGQGAEKSGYLEAQGTNSIFDAPLGIAADYQGNLYVCDTGNDLIRLIDTNRSTFTIAGSNKGGGTNNAGFIDGLGEGALFSIPIGITISGISALYVCDNDNNTVRKIDTNLNVTTIAGSQKQGYLDGIGTNAIFSSPVGLVVNALGDLLVTDFQNNVIRKIDSRRNVTTVVGSPDGGFFDGNGTNALFSAPTGIGSDAQSNLFVADTGNNAIRMIDSHSNVTTIAGYPLPGYVDGPGSMALFDSPMGIAVATNGVVYVADSANNVIRKITHSSGGFTTNQAILTAYQGTLSNAVILPTIWNGMPVMALAPGALSGQSQVTDLTLPSGITSLPSGIFADCTEEFHFLQCWHAGTVQFADDLFSGTLRIVLGRWLRDTRGLSLQWIAYNLQYPEGRCHHPERQ